MCPSVVDCFEAAAAAAGEGHPCKQPYRFDKRASDLRWHSPEDIAQSLASEVVVWPGSAEARQILGKLDRDGLVLKDGPLLCKPMLYDDDGEEGDDVALGRCPYQGGRGAKVWARDDANASGVGLRAELGPHEGSEADEEGPWAAWRDTQTPFDNRPPWLNDGWELQLKVDEGTGGQGAHIRVRHRNDPVIVLFLLAFLCGKKVVYQCWGRRQGGSVRMCVTSYSYSVLGAA